MNPAILIPIIVTGVSLYFNIHALLSGPFVLVAWVWYALYTWTPNFYGTLVAYMKNRNPDRPPVQALKDYRNLSPSYNFYEPFASRGGLIFLLFLIGFALFAGLHMEAADPTFPHSFKFVLIGIAALYIFFKARYGHGQARLKSATPLPEPPPPLMAGGTMRATLQRRDAVYADGPKAEMLLWLQVSDTARALLKKSSLQNVKIFRTEIEPRYLYLYKDAPFVEDKKYIPRTLQNVLDRQPYLIQGSHALELDDIERQIEANLKQLRDVLTNLDARKPAAARTIEI